MVPDSSTPTDASATDREFSAVVSGVLGGLVGAFLSFVPFATVLGGGVAGYLTNGTPREGARAGAIAGFVMFIPVTLVLFFLLFLLGFGGAPAAIGVLGLVVVFFVALYTLGLGALGGYLGAAVRTEW